MSIAPVTRRCIARSEIDTAIELFLSHRDPISAHVLAWAAVEVLKGVAIFHGKKTHTFQFEQWMGTDLTNQWYKSAKHNYNFFKHSDRNPDAQLANFTAEDSASVLMRACLDYRKVYDQMTWSMYMFLQWYLCRNLHLVEVEYREEMASTNAMLNYPHNCTFEDSTSHALSIINDGKDRGIVVLENCPGLIEP